MPAKIVVTAESADVKVINRLLLHLRSWSTEYQEDLDCFCIARTLKDDLKTGQRLEEDKPPLQEFNTNEWKGLSIEEAEELIKLDTSQRYCTDSSSTVLFLMLDEEGVATETVLVFHQAMDSDDEDEDEAEPIERPNEFDKMRVPWDHAQVVWANLDIAHLHWLEFTIEGREHLDQSWWTYRTEKNVSYYTDEQMRRRTATIKELKKLDLA